MPTKPSIIIYRNKLLLPSETFIRSQSEALRSFTPYYVGLFRVKGLNLPDDRTMVMNSSKLWGKASLAFHKAGVFRSSFVQKIRQLNPVLVHAHFGPDGVTALALQRSLCLPLLVSFHGFDATVKDEYARRSFFGHRIYIRHREEFKRETRLFIAVSKFVKSKLLEQGFPPEKIVVHYIGVDTELFQPDPTIERCPIVLFVGRLIEKKGCEYLIRAMSEVQATSPEVELLVIGDGPLRSSLQRLAAKSLHRYRFLGLQPSESVRVWMSRATVLSVPGVTAKSGDAEGFGLVFAEAQAMGLPVVSFLSGGIPEAVDHGKTGFLVPERDWEGLARHILLLFKENKLWQRFSSAGQSRIRSLFELKKQTSELEEIYKRVLNERGGGSDQLAE